MVIITTILLTTHTRMHSKKFELLTFLQYTISRTASLQFIYIYTLISPLITCLSNGMATLHADTSPICLDYNPRHGAGQKPSRSNSLVDLSLFSDPTQPLTVLTVTTATTTVITDTVSTTITTQHCSNVTYIN